MIKYLNPCVPCVPMPEHRCSCGRKFNYNIVTGRFNEMIIDEDVVLKIRCARSTREDFKKLKMSKEMPSYESLLKLLMSVSSL